MTTTASPPDWFAPPATTGIRQPRSSLAGQSRELVYRIIEQIEAGELALAPWQRPSVWTDDQRVRLLDSMIRRLDIGPITLWHPTRGGPAGRPFAGCKAKPGVPLVVDGQQRLTTLHMAALGELDHWRWDGADWTTGQGFVTPSLAVRGLSSDLVMGWYDWIRASVEDRSVCRRCSQDLDAIARTDLSLMVLQGSAEQMVETYCRLATCGSPHSVEDLAVMERWLANR